MLNYILMAQPEGGQASPYSGLVMMLLIVVVFYFFMIRPQMKRQKELRKFRESIQKGDNVVTTGGIYGKVAEVKDNVVLLQVDEGVKLKVDKSAVVKDMSDVAEK